MYEAETWIWTSFPEKVRWEDSEPPSAVTTSLAVAEPCWPQARATCSLWPWSQEWWGSVFWVERQPDCDFLWQGLHSAREDFLFKIITTFFHTQTNISIFSKKKKERKKPSLPLEETQDCIEINPGGENCISYLVIAYNGLPSSVQFCAQSLSCVWLFANLWTEACQASLSMEFSRHEYWSGLPFPPLGDLSDPRIEPVSSVSPALASGFFTTEPPGKPSMAQW